MVLEIAHEADPVTEVIEVVSVGAFDVPAAAFVDVSVAADQEGVADVPPAAVVHVEVLHASHHGSAIDWREALLARGVMHE